MDCVKVLIFGRIPSTDALRVRRWGYGNYIVVRHCLVDVLEF
jgi:hypothetical protein